MNAMFGLFNLGGTEVILILALALILFGGKKLPELAKGLGQGIKEFKKATRDVTDEIQNASNENTYSAPRPAEQPKQIPQNAPYAAPQNVLEAKKVAEAAPAEHKA